MLKEFLLLWTIIGVIALADAVVWAKMPRFTGLASTAIWFVLAFGYSSIDFIQENGQLEPDATSEAALVYLCLGAALVSVVFMLAAWTNQHPNTRSDEKLIDPREVRT